MTRKLNFLLACFAMFMAGSAVAQENTVGFSDDVVKDSEQNKAWKSGTNRYPSKPRDMWELGLHGGYLQYAGDVNARPGYGFGLHLRKSLGYSFALRLNGMYGVAKGLNYLPSNFGVGMNNVLGVGNTMPNGDPSLGYGTNVTNENTINEDVIVAGADKYGDAGLKKFFYNYKSTYTEVSLQGIITLNNLKFHKERNKWDLFGIFGIGANTYSTKHDALGADNKRYNMNDIDNFRKDNADGRRETKDKLKSMLDGTYETYAEEWGYLWDLTSDGGNKVENKYRKINPIANVGVGLGYKLSRRVSLTLEHQATFNDDDLLDGYRWTEQRDFTQNKDVPHYTNVRLNFHLGSFKKRVEPLWWLNPLDAPFAQIQSAKQIKPPTIDDSDGDGVIDQLDREPNTPADCPVDTRGVQLDSDGDGVKDCVDKEPYSRPGVPVDANGVGPAAKVPDFDCATCPPPPSFLPIVTFCEGSACLTAQGQGELKAVANMLSSNPNTSIILEGYADDMTSDATGISYNRAKAVADYLTARGVNASRIAIKARGNAEKAAPNASSDTERMFNRRVEIKLGNGSSDANPGSSAGLGGRCSCEPVITIPAPMPEIPRTPRPSRGFKKG